MKIYIPSHNRAHPEMISSGPLACMGQEAIDRVSYVVHTEQLSDYQMALDKSPFDNVNIIGVETENIAQTRHRIGKYCEAHGQNKFVMMDDDIQFLIRKSPDVWNLRGTEPHEVDQMLSWVEALLDDHAHVGVSPREGQNNLGIGGPDLLSLNTRTLRALAYRTKDFLSVEHERVTVMEDFDTNLQLLRLGLSNANVAYWAQGQKMTNAPGGCSVYRTHDVHQRSAEKLAELHHPFVTLVEKTNKTDQSGFGTRKEVRIQWKKAYAEGVAKCT